MKVNYLYLALAVHGVSAQPCKARDPCVALTDEFGHVYTDYIPDCSGVCYEYSSFQGVIINSGQGVNDGAACAIYYDTNCSNFMQNVGDLGGLQDLDGVAQSMKCYANC